MTEDEPANGEPVAPAPEAPTEGLPDLSKTPLHTLSREELIAKLKTLT